MTFIRVPWKGSVVTLKPFIREYLSIWRIFKKKYFQNIIHNFISFNSDDYKNITDIDVLIVTYHT